MGRGRAKAKQVKVARQLKYNSGGIDLDRLRAEVVGGTDKRDEPEPSYDDLADRYADEDDDYADYADEDDEFAGENGESAGENENHPRRADNAGQAG
jgi:Protein of unknown function (DUF3073)